MSNVWGGSFLGPRSESGKTNNGVGRLAVRRGWLKGVARPEPHRGYRPASGCGETMGIWQVGVVWLDAVGGDGSGCGTDGSVPSASLGMTVRGMGWRRGIGMDGEVARCQRPSVGTGSSPANRIESGCACRLGVVDWPSPPYQVQGKLQPSPTGEGVFGAGPRSESGMTGILWPRLAP